MTDTERCCERAHAREDAEYLTGLEIQHALLLDEVGQLRADNAGLVSMVQHLQADLDRAYAKLTRIVEMAA